MVISHSLVLKLDITQGLHGDPTANVLIIFQGQELVGWHVTKWHLRTHNTEPGITPPLESHTHTHTHTHTEQNKGADHIRLP